MSTLTDFTQPTKTSDIEMSVCCPTNSINRVGKFSLTFLFFNIIMLLIAIKFGDGNTRLKLTAVNEKLYHGFVYKNICCDLCIGSSQI